MAELHLQLLLPLCMLIALQTQQNSCKFTPDCDLCQLQVPDPKNPVKSTEQREQVTFSGPVDSVYLKAKDYVELDVGTGQPLGFACHRLLAGMLVTYSLRHMAVGHMPKALLRDCLPDSNSCGLRRGADSSGCVLCCLHVQQLMVEAACT